MKELNREAWLGEVSRLVKPLFKQFHLPAHKLTCGWPSKHALGKTQRRVGECFSPKCSTAGIFEIFISPFLDDSLEVAGTVCHELAHVAAGIEAGHGRDFWKVCQHVGITKGRPTTAMPNELLNQTLQRLIEPLGAYPHSKLQPVAKTVEKEKKSVTLVCPSCFVKVRISKKHLAQSGHPTCGCNTGFVLKEELEDDG